MSTKLQTKVQANTTPTFTPVLQKPSPLSDSLHHILQRRDHQEPIVQEPGQPVPGTPAFIDPRFGHDFSRVRIYDKGAVPIQAKLRINKPGDVYEEEADRVAEQVMRMEVPGVRRQVEEEEEETLQAKEIPSQIPEVTPNLEAGINTIRGGGQPLPESTRAFFEPRFGHDFSQVRVHTDAKAAEAARAVNARAFTVGQDVVFGEGQYAPEVSEGRRLMAHELTHVVQQKSKIEKGRDIQTKPAAKPHFESVVLKDIPFDPNPRRELFFEADVLKRLDDKLANVRIPDPWGPHLMWMSNFRRDVYRKLMDMKSVPKTASIAVDFIKGATSEESSLWFAVVRTSLVVPPIESVEPVDEPKSEELAPVEPEGYKVSEERRTKDIRLATGEFKFDIPIFPSRPVPVGTHLLAWVNGTASIRLSLPESPEKILVSLRGVEFQKKLSDSLKLHGGPAKLAASINGRILGEAGSIKAGWQGGGAPIFIEARWHAIEHHFIINGVEITGKLILNAKISLSPSPGSLLFIGRTAPLVGAFVLVLSMPFILADATKQGEAWGKNVSFRNGYAWRVAGEAAGVHPGEWLKYVEDNYFRIGSANESFRNGWKFVSVRISVLKSKGELESFCNAIKVLFGTNQVDKLADGVFREIGGIEKEAYPPSNLWQLAAESDLYSVAEILHTKLLF